MTTIRMLPSLRLPPLVRSDSARLSPHVLAVLALVSANIVWGGSAVASKAALAHLPPLTLSCLRIAIALAVLWPLLARSGGRPATGRSTALLGLTGVALFCACQNLGLRFADAAPTALINGTIPVLTALFAVPMLGERLGGRRLTGLLVSLFGVVAIVALGSARTLTAAALDNLLPLASAASFAAYTILGRRAFGGAGALAVVTGSTRYGLLFLLPAACIEVAMAGIERLTVRDLLLLFYLGAGCSAVAFVLLGYGLTHLQASQGAVFGNIKPLVGVALAVVLLGESLTAGQLGGAALVLAGVWLGAMSGRLVSAARTSHIAPGWSGRLWPFWDGGFRRQPVRARRI